ncbi:hypothetical protein LUZ60_009093 [Juncus effusus]|nr:hypothetical protein LUZ60_009093 [Juncus effusus]
MYSCSQNNKCALKISFPHNKTPQSQHIFSPHINKYSIPKQIPIFITFLAASLSSLLFSSLEPLSRVRVSLFSFSITMMQQGAGGMSQPPSGGPPPPQGLAPAQWGAIPPPMQAQYQQAPPQAMWGQQPAASMYGAAPAAAPLSGGSDEVRTLWIGDLQYWMDENYVHSCFAQTGEVQNVKLIRDKSTGQLQGYGFIEFSTRSTAERVIQAYNGQLMPSTEQPFRLNWASAGEKKDDAPEFTIFVGDLAPDVTDYMLQEAFRSHYPSVKGAKVVSDKLTGRSKGYGFVKFGDMNEQNRAMTEMNGMFVSSRPMRIGPATNKTKMGLQKDGGGSPASQTPTDPSNTTLFVGGIDMNINEDHLRQVFSTYGELVSVKIPAGKKCAFVQFANKACAEEALLMLQGTTIGGQSVRLSWGRSPTNKQQQDGNQWGGAGAGYYGAGAGYGQGGYEAYGAAYGAAGQDPNMYAAAYGAAAAASYGGYPNYSQQQQQQQPQQ